MYELNKAGAELDRWVDDLLDDIKYSDEMSHSYKGSEWKDHKYIKKEDGRYYYPKESAASGSYDNDIEFKKDKIEELYNIKIHHTEALQKAIESGDTASADKYKEYIKNIDAQIAALKEELDDLSSHAHPNFKTPDNARRLNHSELMHYGVGPDDNPPGRGSGRYPKGSGERPFQHDPEEMAKKKKSLFGDVRANLAKRRKEKEEAKRVELRQRQRIEALKKARETRAANKAKAMTEKEAAEKHETDKKVALASGDPEKISKYLSELSNEEQLQAIDRIRQTKAINDSAKAQQQEREAATRIEQEANRPKTKDELNKEKFDRFMTRSNQLLDRATQFRNMAEKGIDVWNTLAAINNTFNAVSEMPMIKRADVYFKEKADKEAAKTRREQQLEDAKTKRENDLADALRKEQREDEKWEKEFQAKYNKNSQDVDIKSTKSDKNSETSKQTSTENTKEETSAERSSETQDWYSPDNIARALLTSTPESRKQAEDSGTKFWMTVVNGGNQALNPSTARESERDYYRDRVNENARYNSWETEQARKSAERMRLQSESTKPKKSQDTNEQSLKRMAQQYKYAQSILETRRQQRDRAQSTGTNLDYYDKAVKEASEDMAKLSENYEKFRKYL